MRQGLLVRVRACLSFGGKMEFSEVVLLNLNCLSIHAWKVMRSYLLEWASGKGLELEIKNELYMLKNNIIHVFEISNEETPG
jgi:hypothetical protein